MAFGVGIIGFACAGMYVSNRLEERIVPTEEDKKRLEESLPLRIQTVERTPKR